MKNVFAGEEACVLEKRSLGRIHDLVDVKMRTEEAKIVRRRGWRQRERVQVEAETTLAQVSGEEDAVGADDEDVMRGRMDGYRCDMLLSWSMGCTSPLPQKPSPQA